MTESNLIFTKIWEDDGLYEIKVKCFNASISVSTNIYVTEQKIQALFFGLKLFIDKAGCSPLDWESGSKGNETTPSVCIRLWKKDLCGHYRAEVYLEFNDGGDLNSHNCSMYLDCETQQLVCFCDQLNKVSDKWELNRSVSLFYE